MRHWDSRRQPIPVPRIVDRYSPSFRSYPSQVSAPDYEVGVTVRKVRTNGEIKWRGDKIYLSEALRGEPVYPVTACRAA